MKGKLIYAILIVAFVFRFISVSNFPIGLNADEASFGYDAYSILKTGKDQWGNVLPLVLKSFGDNKSPVYTYLSIPAIAIFGLNRFGIRLTSVFIGTLAVLAVYLLSRRLTKSENIGLVAAFLLAINPWSVMLSRGAAEANLITFFLPLGIYFFLLGVEKTKYLSFAALFFGVNLFTYHSAKLITPIVVLTLLFVFRNKLLDMQFKKLLLPILIFTVFFMGFLYTFKLGGGSRITERSILQGALEEGAETKIKLIQSGQNPIIAKIFHNKYQVIVGRFASNYEQYFSFRFLFTNGVGDASYVMVPGFGVLNIIEGILFIGLIPLFFMQKNLKRVVIPILGWLLISPLPAALATGAGYSGGRASGMIPVLQILEALGFMGWQVFLQRTNKKILLPTISIFVVITLFGIYQFVNFYFKNPTNLIQRQMLYGSLEVGQWLSENGGTRKIIVSRSISEPQIFIALGSKWDPVDYQNETKSWGFDKSNTPWVDQLPSYSLGNYTIKSVDWKKDDLSNSLVVVRADEYQGKFVPIKVITYTDGSPNIYVIDTSQKVYAKAY